MIQPVLLWSDALLFVLIAAIVGVAAMSWAFVTGIAAIPEDPELDRVLATAGD